MKNCPYCAEEIQDEALKCRFCNEFIDQANLPKKKQKWYLSKSLFILTLLSVGPLALPLLWINPEHKKSTKIVLTLVIIVFSVWSFFIIRDTYLELMKQIKQLGIL